MFSKIYILSFEFTLIKRRIPVALSPLTPPSQPILTPQLTPQIHPIPSPAQQPSPYSSQPMTPVAPEIDYSYLDGIDIFIAQYLKKSN